ncbi:hypothetical protein VTL71DRAFT_8199 [Oculimacula yallundae]|uniref:Uncharacterized protein n=1 Tax=Oculimacula yallundae TaxID=86028 RepID=A0ABR4CY54_9HELO
MGPERLTNFSVQKLGCGFESSAHYQGAAAVPEAVLICCN